MDKNNETHNVVRVPVLVVGAGPVGLSTAIELGSRQVPCLLIERNDRVGYAPRAKTTNVRTREHMRRWGIAKQLRAASPLGLDYPSNVVFCTKLSGPELTRFENAFYCAPGRNPLYSEHAQWIPQYSVEEVMRAHAEKLPGVALRFNCELLSFTQGVDGVHAVARDLTTHQQIHIHADYLVGADGARSLVREAMGAKLEGTYGLSRNYNVVFRAPGLAQAHQHGPAIMYWQVNQDVPSLIGPMDRGDKWFFMPTQVDPSVKLQPADAPDLIRRATGIDLPYEVLSTDEWVASQFLGNQYRSGRVFLAGDACHLHPPFGGYGMNMGVSDGVDLGWKIAAVLQGWGGEALLASYEAERRPVHQLVLDEAVANHTLLGRQLWQDGMDADSPAGAAIRQSVGARIQSAKIREFATLGVVLGYRYDHSPVIVPDGSPAPGNDFINYRPTSRPGALAPHAWRHDGSSLYDHFGSGLTLLAHPSAPKDEIENARQRATQLRVPLQILQAEEAGIAELYPTRYTLIRPDQHVAWRGDSLPAAIDGLLAHITGRLVAQPAKTSAAAALEVTP